MLNKKEESPTPFPYRVSSPAVPSTESSSSRLWSEPFPSMLKWFLNKFASETGRPLYPEMFTVFSAAEPDLFFSGSGGFLPAPALIKK